MFWPPFKVVRKYSLEFMKISVIARIFVFYKKCFLNIKKGFQELESKKNVLEKPRH